jgi:hypothetical protein
MLAYEAVNATVEVTLKIESKEQSALRHAPRSTES